MKTQLISGVQNIIAIDLVKKETFQKKRQENLKSKKAAGSNEFALPQDTLEISPEVMAKYKETQQPKPDVDPLTNAELLSQTFEKKEIHTENTLNSGEYLEIVNEIAKAMDILDNVSAKVVKLMPTNVKKESSIHQDLLTPVNNDYHESVQNTSNQELQPFSPERNIFDVSQGPNL